MTSTNTYPGGSGSTAAVVMRDNSPSSNVGRGRSPAPALATTIEHPSESANSANAASSSSSSGSFASKMLRALSPHGRPSASTSQSYGASSSSSSTMTMGDRPRRPEAAAIGGGSAAAAGAAGGTGTGSFRRQSFTSIMSRSQSQSRGRDYVSTGRGGSGNLIRSPSRNGALPSDEGLVAGSERGRTLSPVPVGVGAAGGGRTESKDRVIHAGRGGLGNTRSPSTARERIEEQREDALESKLVAERRGRERATDAPFSTGRGGAGNIGGQSRSRSRSRPAAAAGNGHAAVAHHAIDGSSEDKYLPSRTTTRGSTATGSTVTPGTTAAVGGGGGAAAVPTLNGGSPANGHSQHVYATGGRGGYGNAFPVENSEEQRKLAEAEQREQAEIRKKLHESDGHPVHSSGKGGAGNIVPSQPNDGVSGDLSNLTIAEEEAEARAKQHERDSKHGFTGGRGGAGNFHHGGPSAAAAAATEEDGSARGRGRASEGGSTKQHGVVGSILRSLSRATRDKDEKKK